MKKAFGLSLSAGAHERYIYTPRCLAAAALRSWLMPLNCSLGSRTHSLKPHALLRPGVAA